jgi:UDP-4-amino-4,6-dideoxy-N-acetyl-beta-L-altrosamine transaminase
MKKFISYGRQWVDENDIKAVEEVLESDFLVQGPRAEVFAKSICDYTGAKYCVVVSSGTAALHLAVLALQITPGGEGITSPNTFVASSNALIYGDLRPVFADIDSKTYCIDPAEIAKKITKKTKVIIPVDFAGQPAEMEKIHALARKNKIAVIEDAAHAIGSVYKDGSRVGGCKYSDLTIFSFHPVKTITCGEGGAITTNSKKLYERLVLLQSHGITKKPKQLKQNPGPWYYEMQTLGFNYRLTDIQCALGASQMKKLNFFKKRRREIVKKYNIAFAGLKNVTIPFEREGVDSAFHLYVLKIDFKKLGRNRKLVMADLKSRGVGTQVHYIPVHFQPYYRKNFGYKKGDFPICEDYYGQALSIPLFPKMTDADVKSVIGVVKGALK